MACALLVGAAAQTTTLVLGAQTVGSGAGANSRSFALTDYVPARPATTSALLLDLTAISGPAPVGTREICRFDFTKVHYIVSYCLKECFELTCSQCFLY